MASDRLSVAGALAIALMLPLALCRLRPRRARSIRRRAPRSLRRRRRPRGPAPTSIHRSDDADRRSAAGASADDPSRSAAGREEDVLARPADPIARGARTWRCACGGGPRRRHAKHLACITSTIATACCTPRTSAWSRSRTAVGTPFYCYSTATIERHYRVFAGAFADVDSLVCYSVKANSNQAVIATLARLGAGADVVSEGELLRARAAGIPPTRSCFPASARRRASLRSRSTTASSASMSNRKRRSSCSPRSPPARAVPPTFRSASIPISTPRPTPRSRPAKSENKFGIPISRAREVYARAAQAQRRARRRRRHAYRQPDRRTRPVRRRVCAARRLRARRCAPTGTPSRTSISAAGSAFPIARTTSRRRIRPLTRPSSSARPPASAASSIFEPGRLIVGNAGILVTRVLYVKHGEAKTFVIIDAGMNDLVRPTLYDAHHEIVPVRRAPAGAERIIADVVGPVCESGDFLALDRSLPAPQPGDLLAVMSAGAYGAVQSGTYNSRPLVPEVLVRAGEWALVRPRVTAEALIALDRLPPWLSVALALNLHDLQSLAHVTVRLERALMLTCCHATFSLARLRFAELSVTRSHFAQSAARAARRRAAAGSLLAAALKRARWTIFWERLVAGAGDARDGDRAVSGSVVARAVAVAAAARARRGAVGFAALAVGALRCRWCFCACRMRPTACAGSIATADLRTARRPRSPTNSRSARKTLFAGAVERPCRAGAAGRALAQGRPARRRASPGATLMRCAASFSRLHRHLLCRRRRAGQAHRRGVRLARRGAAGQFPRRRLGHPAALYRQAAGHPARHASRRELRAS